METTESNKLIAEFMGWEFEGAFYNPYRQFGLSLYNPITYGNRAHHVEQLCFHISWDWLMPVVEKINKWGISQNGNYWQFDIRSGEVEIKDFNGLHILQIIGCSLELQTTIQATYNCVVDFIQWHNTQTKPIIKEKE